MVNELIYVVDDDAPLRGLMKALLEDQGYAVQDFESGIALLEALDDNPSLILLDVMMPGMDGFEVCRRQVRQYAGPSLRAYAVRPSPSSGVQGF